MDRFLNGTKPIGKSTKKGPPSSMISHYNGCLIKAFVQRLQKRGMAVHNATIVTYVETISDDFHDLKSEPRKEGIVREWCRKNLPDLHLL